MKWKIAACLLLALLTLSVARASTRPAAELPLAPTFLSEMTYYVEPSGQWRAKNPSAGRPGQPEEYGYEFAWDMRKRVVTNRIFGVFANGSERDYWLYVSSWNPRDRRIQLHGYGSDGRLTVGTHELDDKWTYLEGLEASGADFAFKEARTDVTPDSFVSHSYDRTPQGYTESSVLLWERQDTLRRR